MYIRSMMEYKKHRLINSLVRLREYIVFLLLLYTHEDIRDLATVLQELTSNHQFDYANNWKQLGLYLGLYQPTLNAIEVNCRGQVWNCLMECISSWLKGEDGVKETRGGGSNWISLVAALEAMGEREVANNIRIKYNLHV